MKNIKNNKTILAVIPAVVVLAAGVAFFCSRSGNTDKQCQETVERLQKLETADISSIEDADPCTFRERKAHRIGLRGGCSWRYSHRCTN